MAMSAGTHSARTTQQDNSKEQRDHREHQAIVEISGPPGNVG